MAKVTEAVARDPNIRMPGQNTKPAKLIDMTQKLWETVTDLTCKSRADGLWIVCTTRRIGATLNLDLDLLVQLSKEANYGISCRIHLR